MLYFDWDPLKAAANLEKHGIAFEAASAALEDPFALEEEDQVIDGEHRLRTIGMATTRLIVTVSHGNASLGSSDEVARIISARKATRSEGETMTVYVRRAAGTPLSEEALDQLRRLTELPDDEIDLSDIPERIPGERRLKREHQSSPAAAGNLDKAS